MNLTLLLFFTVDKHSVFPISYNICRCSSCINDFIDFIHYREKQGKVGDEELRAQQEIHLQKQASIELDQKSKLFQTFKEAKDVLQLAVSDKKIFAEYLDSVVRIQADKYQDILQLMDRCQGLVTSR